MTQKQEKQLAADAAEFGNHLSQGGWRLGLLVARNVRKGKPGAPQSPSAVKVTATEFTKMAKLNKSGDAHRVLRYLASWDAAAAEGHVPPSAELSPATEVDLDAEQLPDWSDFYPDSTKGDHRYDAIEQREALEAQAKADGVGHTKVLDIAKNSAAMASAIKGDPKVAAAADKAVKEAQYTAYQKMIKEQGPASESTKASFAKMHEKQAEEYVAAHHMRWMDAVEQMNGVRKRLRDSLKIVRNVKFSDEEIESITDHIKMARQSLDLLEMSVTGNAPDLDWDAEFAKLTTEAGDL